MYALVVSMQNSQESYW